MSQRAPAGAAPAATALPPPPGVDLACLQGVRAVASLGVVALHCFMFWQFFLPHDVKYRLTQHNPVIKLASAGMVWVDVLFVLSAALAAFSLLPALEGSGNSDSSSSGGSEGSDKRGRGGTQRFCRQVVLSYWTQRARRVLPAYAAANLLTAVALGPAEGVPFEAAVARMLPFSSCPRTLWANVLLIQNFLFSQACGIHLWTVSLQAQFYLLFPLLLCALRPRTPGFRARLAAALAALAVSGTAWRLWAAWKIDFLELPVADFAVDKPSQLSWANMVHATYVPTASRAAELALGAGLGLLLRSPAALQLAKRRRGIVAVAALCLQAAYAHLLLTRHLLFRPPGGAPWPLDTARLHIALLSFGSPFMAATVAATLLALMLHADPLHTAAARVLDAAAWRPVARLSYSLYLMHEQARLWTILCLLPAGFLPRVINEHPLLSFIGVALGTTGAGYAAALPLHLLVERRWAGAA